MVDKEIFQGETILALQGGHLDPISALKQAKEIFKCSGAILPLDLALFRLVWFMGRGRQYHNWTYIRFDFPVPEQLRTHNSWDLPRFIKDFETSGRQFIETEPTAIRLQNTQHPPLFMFIFLFYLIFSAFLVYFVGFLLTSPSLKYSISEIRVVLKFEVVVL